MTPEPDLRERYWEIAYEGRVYPWRPVHPEDETDVPKLVRTAMAYLRGEVQRQGSGHRLTAGGHRADHGAFFRRRRNAATPAMPLPKSSQVAGSGVTVDAVRAKSADPGGRAKTP